MTKPAQSADWPVKKVGCACRLAYVRALKEAHPDKGGATEHFYQVQAAYHRLEDTH